MHLGTCCDVDRVVDVISIVLTKCHKWIKYVMLKGLRNVRQQNLLQFSLAFLHFSPAAVNGAHSWSLLIILCFKGLLKDYIAGYIIFVYCFLYTISFVKYRL